MADFTIKSESVDVEEIMRRIRARIREKRGVDYTEEEMRELASVKLERFLDPRALRADLLQHFRQQQARDPLPPVPPLENYAFDADTIYKSHRGPLRWIRRLLNPLLKLLFNPNPLIHVLHLQGRINTQLVEHLDALHREMSRRDELGALNYEVMTNLVLELTRLGIENRNVKMRVESLSTRLDFDERRARALEGVVQYRPGAVPSAPAEETRTQEAGEPAEGQSEPDAAGRPGKRRRRRRGRRRGPGDELGASPENGGADEGNDRSARAADQAHAGSPEITPPAGESGDVDSQ